MHRDIKPENVIFTESKILKLADFGLALDLNEERANTRAGIYGILKVLYLVYVVMVYLVVCICIVPVWGARLSTQPHA